MMLLSTLLLVPTCLLAKSFDDVSAFNSNFARALSSRSLSSMSETPILTEAHDQETREMQSQSDPSKAHCTFKGSSSCNASSTSDIKCVSSASFAQDDHCLEGSSGSTLWEGCTISLYPNSGDCTGDVGQSMNLDDNCTANDEGVGIECFSTSDIPKIPGGPAYAVYSGSASCGGGMYVYHQVPTAQELCMVDRWRLINNNTQLEAFTADDCTGSRALSSYWDSFDALKGSNPTSIEPNTCYGGCSGDTCVSIIIWLDPAQVPATLSSSAFTTASALALFSLLL